ncbi:MAG TPA: D-alanyl-D-alanine carboxypeptidase, partial [Candidatus Blautia intestinipullorum]|nr:D-alanyl-D-alanine carboxypeptidase [Candidatus Blautia intestinipullorum]
ETAAAGENTAAAAAEPQTGEAVQTSGEAENSQEAQDASYQETEKTAQTDKEEESEGLSDTAKHLLIAGGCMGVLLIALLIALYIKNDY